MSKEIQTSMKNHTMTEFWGGKQRGVCVQVTAADVKIADTVADQIQNEGYITLTMMEAATLANELSSFVAREALRRKDLLSKNVRSMRELEKTIFEEVAALGPELFEPSAPLSVSLVDKFCPISDEDVEDAQAAVRDAELALAKARGDA